jgi:hypothetical protein
MIALTVASQTRPQVPIMLQVGNLTRLSVRKEGMVTRLKSIQTIAEVLLAVAGDGSGLGVPRSNKNAEQKRNH